MKSSYFKVIQTIQTSFNFCQSLSAVWLESLMIKKIARKIGVYSGGSNLFTFVNNRLIHLKRSTDNANWSFI